MPEASALASEPALYAAAWFLLLAVFALALPGKLRDFEAFVGTVRNYRLLPAVLARPVALGIVAAELSVLLGLLLPWTRSAAAALAASLLALFACAVAVNLARGRRGIDCGCFRTLLRERLSWWHVARNGFLCAAALFVATAAPRPAGFLDLAVAALAAASFVLLFLAGAQLAFDPRHELVSEGTGAGSGSPS
ncbi:MAG: methylamine utilization protein MauE [Geminicoccaceae bacterium]|nr:methylamine utilization protein MauE [Geminicoccaceae bacterium]